MLFRKPRDNGSPDFTAAADRPPAAAGEPAGDARAVEGYVDVVDEARVAGWAYDPGAPASRLVIEVSAGDRAVTVLANGERPDLRDLGKGDGIYGFSAAFPLGEVGDTPVHVRAVATGADLVGSPFRPDLPGLLRSPLNRGRLDLLRSEAQLAAVALKGGGG